ncbi:MAG: EamA-like transporter family protein [Candidatus Udaeobacter sp.]|nr:MAG: EamA-like transporter family protein [Candidatus Udaeobacter sp.]
MLTLLAMIAFASNSLLCRAALKESSIDPATFTFLRIFSGAVALWLIMTVRKRMIAERTSSPLVETGSSSSLVARHVLFRYGNWISAAALFVYAAGFSFAYVSLSAGTGALLLFAAVQATMILWGLHKGERLSMIQIVGFILAVIGFVVLVFPGLSAPPLAGSILMLGAGVAWGVYSLRGKGERNAASVTAGNFVRAVPFATALIVIFAPWTHVDLAGIAYAIISGAVTSGLGYVVWYKALPGLKAASAATVQLSVPVLAATGGILLLGEPITLRYLLASVAVLGGIALVVATPHLQQNSPRG